ncbi:hypothetical protein QA802_37010 [Streptomyces sp. B21-105]
MTAIRFRDVRAPALRDVDAVVCDVRGDGRPASRHGSEPRTDAEARR